MRKKKMALWTSLGFVFVAAVLTGMGLLLKHEPGFYRRAAVGQGEERKNLNTELVGGIGKLSTFWKYGKGNWNVTFSEAQINSYFVEGFVRWGDAEALRKQGISEPRLIIEPDRLRLAFRYGNGLWSTIVSYDVKLWLAPNDVNVVLMEVMGHRAGSLPLSTQSLLNEISEAARRHNIDVMWYRHEGRPVAMIRFQEDQSRPTAQLVRLEAKQGLLLLSGKSNDAQNVVEPPSPAPK